MSSTRATTYITAASVLVAWLAATDSVPSRPAVTVTDARPAAAADAAGRDLRAETQRLAERMAVAPRPRRSARNPFAFHTAAPLAGGTSERALSNIPAAAPAPPSEPRLDLVGIAGQDTPDGVVRTAMVMADGDTFLMLTTGQTIGARYRVDAIGPDTVDLSDLTTGGTRSLRLK